VSLLPIGAGAADYVCGNFGTSPLFAQLNGKLRRANTFVAVVSRSKHKGMSRL
jgi:hypothetical protein